MENETKKKKVQMLNIARILRRNMTSQEKRLWYDYLRYYPIKVYKQKIIDNYIVDFYCHQARLAIELDGAQHYTINGGMKDAERTKILKTHDIMVLRFSNRDVEKRFKDVCTIINQVIKRRVIEISNTEQEGTLMNKIQIRAVQQEDAQFLNYIMNLESILSALNELPTKLSDWEEAVEAWSLDDDEEDYIVLCNEIPIGWLGINGLCSPDKTAYLKLAAILPDYHNKGIGYKAISEIIEMLRKRNYTSVRLYTDTDNHKARACYSKCGFEVVQFLSEEMANGKTVSRCIMEILL